MKSWKDMAINALKEEQTKQEYRDNLKYDNENNTSTAVKGSALFQKLKKQYFRYYRFKVKQDENKNQYLNNLFIQSEFDESTFDFILETPRWGFISNSMNWLLSWVYTKTDIMGFIGKGVMMCLSTEQYKQILKVNNEEDFTSDYNDGFYYDSLLDIGAGCGSTTEYLKPLFKNITTTEASKGMIYSLNKKGLNPVFCLDLNECQQLKNKKYDIVSCLNVLDRCEKPISLLNTIKNFMKPNGKLILAVVFPFKPYVEFGGINNKPIENIELNQTSLSEYVNSFNTNVFIPNGFILDTFTVGPYISEGDSLYQNYVLTDVIFILKVASSSSSPSYSSSTSTTTTDTEINNLMTCD